MKTFFILVCCLAITGCATVSSQKKTTQLETTPPEAECLVTGTNGYKRSVTTPVTMLIPGEAAPVTIACSKAGYFTATEQIDTKADGWIIGNILMGGIIGAIVDSSRGAGQQYPERVTLILDKQQFDSMDDLKNWYEERKKELNERLDRQIQEITAGCRDEDRDVCGRKVKKINESREKSLAIIKQHRMESENLFSAKSKQ